MYVVAGVSGNTGKVVAETLLAQKQPVRVIVRSAEKGEEWKARGAEVAVAELDDVAALTRGARWREGGVPAPAAADGLVRRTRRQRAPHGAAT